jgi:hypothetical protein
MASIPALSSEYKRVFSQAMLLVAGKRGARRPDSIKAAQCLRMWLVSIERGLETGQRKVIVPNVACVLA